MVATEYYMGSKELSIPTMFAGLIAIGNLLVFLGLFFTLVFYQNKRRSSFYLGSIWHKSSFDKRKISTYSKTAG